MPESSAAKPHSCHTLALLQYISSSQGHDSISPVITTGILIIISTAERIFHANHNRSNTRSENNEGPIWREETYSCVADGAFAETGRNVCLF